MFCFFSVSYLHLISGSVLWASVDLMSVFHSKLQAGRNLQARALKALNCPKGKEEELLHQFFPFSPVLVNIEDNCLNQLSFTAKEKKRKKPQNCQHLEISTRPLLFLLKAIPNLLLALFQYIFKAFGDQLHLKTELWFGCSAPRK